MTIRAVIFDFNGVIVDDERLHLAAFERVVAELGHAPIGEQAYFERYLGLSDRSFFRALLRDRSIEESGLEAMIDRKADVYLEILESGIPLFDAAPDCVARMAGAHSLAIASGARRREIEIALERSDLASFFEIVVSADEVTEGKPDPEGYLLALARLRARVPRLSDLRASECLVVEDAAHGIEAARAAGMRCIAVTSNLPASALAAADRVIGSLAELAPDPLP